MIKNNTEGIADWMTAGNETEYKHEPLNPREAFFGGRTESIRLYSKGEDMQYYDFTSLYPSINKQARYPKKHPIVYTQDFHYDKDANLV